MRILLALSMLFINTSLALENLSQRDFLLHGDQCTNHIEEIEKLYGLPQNLLYSIAIVESGIVDKLTKNPTPWPWVINVQGKGYYFSTKEEALTTVRRLLRAGVNSIDLGCMQVNIKQHPNAFKSLDEAFEPRRNVTYAALFLKQIFNRHGSWKEAVSRYHSAHTKEGAIYSAKVLSVWRKYQGDNSIFVAKN